MNKPMSVKCKDIEGFLVKDIPSDFINDGHPFNNGKAVGYTIAITQQGERSLTLNREKLAEIIYESCSIGNLGFNNEHSIIKKIYFDSADAVIQSLPQLLEVSNEQR